MDESPEVGRILRNALELDEGERVEVAYRLLVSLAGEPAAGSEGAWCAEVAGRLEDLLEEERTPLARSSLETSIRDLLARRRKDSPFLP